MQTVETVETQKCKFRIIAYFYAFGTQWIFTEDTYIYVNCIDGKNDYYTHIYICSMLLLTIAVSDEEAKEGLTIQVQHSYTYTYT